MLIANYFIEKVVIRIEFQRFSSFFDCLSIKGRITGYYSCHGTKKINVCYGKMFEITGLKISSKKFLKTISRDLIFFFQNSECSKLAAFEITDVYCRIFRITLNFWNLMLFFSSHNLTISAAMFSFGFLENDGLLQDGDIMLLPGQRKKYFEPPQNYHDHETEDDIDDADDVDIDDDYNYNDDEGNDADDDNDDDYDPPQNHHSYHLKDKYFEEKTEDDRERENEDHEENIEQDDASKRREQDDIDDENFEEKEKYQWLDELENEIDFQDEDDESEDIGENEVLKNVNSKWPVPIPYVLSSSFSSSEFDENLHFSTFLK